MLRKERLGSENTPQELLVAACSPHKKQKVKEKEKDFVIVRRPRLLREAEPGNLHGSHRCLQSPCCCPCCGPEARGSVFSHKSEGCGSVCLHP